MKSPDRTKAEIEENIRIIAKEILALDEHPQFDKTAKLEEKLNAYSPEWRSRYAEGCSEICLYASKLYPAPKSEDEKDSEPSRAAKHGILIMTIAHNCFKNYREDSGDIIHYISKSFKTEFARAEYEEMVDEMRGGLNPPDHILNLVKQYYSVIEGLGKNPNNIEVQKWYCSRYDIDLKKLQNALKKNFETANTDENSSIKEDKEASVFDKISESSLNSEYDKSEEEKYRLLFEKIEKCYCQEVKAQKGDYSKLITVYLLKGLAKNIKSRLLMADLLLSYSFIDKLTLQHWKHNVKIEDQKSIAIRLYPNSTEKSAKEEASRWMKKFGKKLRILIKEVSTQ